MNRLVSQQGGGTIVFKGTLNEPASVTIDGKPADVAADNTFTGQAEVVGGGETDVEIQATDYSGNLNVRTSTYRVSQGAGTTGFTYDLNGNMTSDGTRTYEWDAENRLVEVKESKEGPTTVASFTYNADGIRTSETVGGVTTTYVLEDDSVVEERQGGSVTKHFQGPGIDNVLGMQNGAGVTYLTRDHLGSIREHTDSVGTLTLRPDYGPWGNTAVGSLNGWGFTGRERDAETGLLYYRARYYRPQIARFLGEDPVGLKAHGANLLAYAANNPVNSVDPEGRDAVVTYWEGASGFGHVGIGVNTDDTGGFYPKKRSACLLWGCGVPGEVANDQKKHPGDQPNSIVIETTAEQDCAMCEAFERRKATPGKYYLKTRNCTQFVADILAAGHVENIPDTWLPDEFFVLLANSPAK